MQLTWIVFVVACVFAMNIGASGAAAAMSGSYGSGAIRSKPINLMMFGIFALLGAVIGGGHVSRTLGSGIVDMSGVLSQPDVALSIVLIILASACITLMTANMLAIPLSTSEVTVGSIVGVGLVIGRLDYVTLFYIVLAWIVLPIAAFFISALGKRIVPDLKGGKDLSKTTPLSMVVIGIGCYNALSAGMNNTANAVAPLISGGLLGERSALWMGGLGLAIGALLIGGPVMETTAKRLANISLSDAMIVTVSGATLILIASLLGLPAPLTQATAAGILGIGWAAQGKKAVQRKQVANILRVWIFSPVVSLILSFAWSAYVLGPRATSDQWTVMGWMMLALTLLILQTDRRVVYRRHMTR